MKVYYQIAPCNLGWLLLAVTERGVCMLSMGDLPGTLRESLVREFPAAECVELRQNPDADGPMGEQMDQWLAVLQQYLNGTSTMFDMPLDLQGTVFQHKVWNELRHIPYGERRSYTQIAEAIGLPKAVRAVARACATNAAALLVPCHRVVSKDGSLAGYRWGLSRKQALLELEKTK